MENNNKEFGSEIKKELNEEKLEKVSGGIRSDVPDTPIIIQNPDRIPLYPDKPIIIREPDGPVVNPLFPENSEIVRRIIP